MGSSNLCCSNNKSENDYIRGPPPSFSPNYVDSAPYISLEDTKPFDDPMESKCQIILESIILELIILLPEINTAYTETVNKYDGPKKLLKAQKKLTTVIN